VLFEEYLHSTAISGDSRSVARLFAPVGIVALLVIAILQVPLAWRMARRIQHAQRDRELLLLRAVTASEQERRSIAAGLHDGVVQELAGHSFRMAAAVEQEQPAGELRRVLAEGAAGTRNAIRQLRSLLLEIYPPALRDHGLAAALPDLAAPLSARGVEVTIDVPGDLTLSIETERLVFRAAQEALRNVAAHADATHVELAVSRSNGVVLLRATDDGRGFDARTREQRRTEGHMGLALLQDLAEAAGGRLRVESRPGEGTTVELEVPAP
jgi:signal transduction histidine kinase